MSLRVQLASITALSRALEQAAQSGAKPTAPTMDIGPSTAAVQATTAEVLRAETGLTEILARTARDLDANKRAYATTDEGNEDLFRPIGR